MLDPGVGLRLETCAELVFLDDRHATPSSRIDEHDRQTAVDEISGLAIEGSHMYARAPTTPKT